jgi:alpha-amylase
MLLTACAIAAALAQSPIPPSSWEKEIVYQIFPRSFYDSNGDRIGDFKGIDQKLDYVKRLGATVILLQPIQKSRLYHNYFQDSFFETDPSFGTNQDFFNLVHDAHARHLKVVLDMEQQYVAGLHPWYVAAKDHPESPEAKYVDVTSGFLGRAAHGYNGAVVPIATVNTSQPGVLDELKKVFIAWAAPEGRPQDGVDGFRLDHMMDDLDNRHQDTNMLAGFWVPIEEAVHSLKPKTFFVAEQSDWGLGIPQFEKGKVDAAYAIPLRFALVSFDPAKIDTELRREQEATPPGKTQLIFVEDHDVERYASVVNNDPARLRLGAVMMLTDKGTPSMYYGQELGMKGVQLRGHTDGNDIPVRLAFRWSKSLEAPGTATWYGAGPWADPAFSANGDGISVEEEEGCPDSLLNFYRRLIAIRKRSRALSSGAITFPSGHASNLISFTRQSGNETVIVAANFGPTAANLNVPAQMGFTDLWTGKAVSGGEIDVPAGGFRILRHFAD